MVSPRHHRECDECGALLGDREKHARWHKAVKRLLDEAASTGDAASRRIDEQQRSAREAMARYNF
jgi:hypothetical protein